MRRQRERVFLVLSLVVWAGLVAGGGPVPASAQCGSEESGADLYGANRQVGGGAGYEELVSRAGARFRVRNANELLAALAQAQPGEVVYVEDDADIALELGRALVLPAGVTLASGRGRNGSLGGRLYTSVHLPESVAWISVPDDGVRITGLRLQGAYQGTADIPQESSGVVVEAGVTDFEVDNCELTGWSYAAVRADFSSVQVHHNHIHHNTQAGLGYGVVLGGEAFALVESNIFDHNRHDIAGSGDPRQGYVARHNLLLGQGTSHAFDMHGERERWLCPSGYAGGQIVVEYNTFVDANQSAVKLRGAPYEHAHVRYNRFTDPDTGHSIVQSWPSTRAPASNPKQAKCDANSPVFGYHTRTGTPYERMTVEPNCVGYTGWFRFDRKYGGFYPLARSNAPLSELRFGDFDGDLRDDVVRFYGGTWDVSHEGTTDWSTIGSSSYSPSVLGVGDFVGDARADVLRASGTGFYVSENGTERWKQLSPHRDKLRRRRVHGTVPGGAAVSGPAASWSRGALVRPP